MTFTTPAQVIIQDNVVPFFAGNQLKKDTSEQIQYLDSNSPHRAPLENLITHVFKKYYNTELEHFYPNLLSIESDQSIKAVAGVRCAADEPLFSEYYLANPLETELEMLYNRKISREYIVEVGNLAPTNVGQMRWLIASITAFLYSAGFQAIVFTAVPGVSNAFKRMNIPLQYITDAEHHKLPEDIQDKWDKQYYQAKPKVFSGDIVAGFNIMKENIYHSNQKLIPLFEKACHLGRQLRHANAATGEVA